MSIAGEAIINMVKLTIKIRDELNDEIMDMPFKENARIWVNRYRQVKRVLKK